jgi:hypothetical protein
MASSRRPVRYLAVTAGSTAQAQASARPMTRHLTGRRRAAVSLLIIANQGHQTQPESTDIVTKTSSTNSHMASDVNRDSYNTVSSKSRRCTDNYRILPYRHSNCCGITDTHTFRGGGARGSAVGSGSMLQVGRSRVRHFMRSSNISLDLILRPH